ncbi:OTU domain-containing protein 6B [Metarhizium rileyi]|uniref:OTU domain-containing protein 6B n=1 Tax=Metarhizium rileyi (strain RCEF 4871) TaxID=1649241 RepID=A0A167DBY1_METRR|nr:OTU domain-containing protein 6B [Metarhizium rileyi RCEF 4871]
MEVESLDQMGARHRRELKDLQGRITSKKKNATKKTRKGVNEDCVEMERTLRERHATEVASLDTASPPTTECERDDEVIGLDGREKLSQQADQKVDTAVDKLEVETGDNAQSQPGKKRNRQKERLARRAAEQEAAAQQAEEEASGMTDHRARESEYMKSMFATYGLVEKEIEPDGHCLFSAVADQLSQNAIPTGRTDASEAEYRTVRRAATAFMAENGHDFAPFLEGDLDSYLVRMRDTADWGGQLELTALARRYGVEIRVVQDGRTEKIGEEEGARTGKVLWLAYYRHGYGLGEHYNSLRKK